MSLTSTGAAVGNLRRVVVGFRSRETNNITLASFVDCIVNYFNPDGVSVELCCKLENNILVLSPPVEHDQQKQEIKINGVISLPPQNLDFSSVFLEHSPSCPMLHRDRGDAASPDRGVAVGVAIIVESSDGRVLVTQRAERMRTFPRAWVPPGGHLEPGETLLEGGRREVLEETGLDLARAPHDAAPLCMWESVYPPYLGMGDPSNHHVVVYIHAAVRQPWRQIQDGLKLDEEEVQACAWLSRSAVASLLAGGGDHRPEVVERFAPGPDGRLVSRPWDPAGLFPLTIPGKRFSGLQSALSRWLNIREKKPACRM